MALAAITPTAALHCSRLIPVHMIRSHLNMNMWRRGGLEGRGGSGYNVSLETLNTMITQTDNTIVKVCRFKHHREACNMYMNRHILHICAGVVRASEIINKWSITYIVYPYKSQEEKA